MSGEAVSPRTDHTPDAFLFPGNCARITRRHAHVQLSPKYGSRTHGVMVNYQLAGARNTPVVVVQGGISAGRVVCRRDGDAGDGWWEALVGPGRAIDLTRVRVLAIDWLTADDIGADTVATADQAAAIASLLDALGIESVYAFVGASYGAMTGLAFAAAYPDRVQELVAVAGADKPHPWATAQRSIQRGILRAGMANGCRDTALSLARQLAMTSYRCPRELARRFAVDPEGPGNDRRLPVEHWLAHVGDQFAAAYSLERYLALSESIDLHAVDPARVSVPTTLIGFDSDQLVPLGDLCRLQRALRAPTSLEVIESPFGHDGFLKEHKALRPLLAAITHAATTA